MSDQGNAMVDPPAIKPRRRLPFKTLAFLLLLLLSFAAFFGWQRREARLDAEEKTAKATIESAGGLVIMDVNRVHPATLNLANTPDDSLDEVVENSQTLRFLKVFDLTNKPITDKHASQLAQLSRLTSLHISGTQIGDAGLQKLTRLSKLQTLLVANTKMTDIGIGHLGRISSLVVLDLSGNQLNGDLAPLVQLPKLQWLVIKDVSLSPKALTQLGAIKSLRRLTTSEDALSDDQIRELKKLNPELNVE